MTETPRDPTALHRLDSFPYRHRVAQVMRSPVQSVLPDTSLLATIRQLRAHDVSALLVMDAADRLLGIVTERDMMRQLAAHGPGALDQPVAEAMTRHVVTVPAAAFAYVAIARMDRLRIRHLVAVDGAGRPVGMVSIRNLLRLRAGEALVIGDHVAVATDADGLRHAWRLVPRLARALLLDGIAALDVAAVIADVAAAMTGRAAELAAEATARDRGPPPAPWAALILGSGGRGESLLIPDQDNALIHAGSDADDAWFAAMAERMNASLDHAGLPFCKGGVMAKTPDWRHTVIGWQNRIDRWAQAPDGENLLAADIFFDLKPVAGDTALAERLRAMALATVRRAPSLLRMLAHDLEDRGSALGFFGGFRTEGGRLDLKLHGTLPLVTLARVQALRHGITATGSRERRAGLAAEGHLPDGDRRAQDDAHELFARLILNQQLCDDDAGRPLSTLVEIAALSRRDRAALRHALATVRDLDTRI